MSSLPEDEPHQVLSLAEHFKGFSAVHLPAAQAAAALEKSLSKFGPVKKSRLSDFGAGVSYLRPLKSFTTRFLVVGDDRWAFLANDMRGEFCYVDAYALSRMTGCNAIGLILQEDRRELHLFEDGNSVREIHSSLDGDRWYFRENGTMQWFEEATEYEERKGRGRLSVEALKRYFRKYTGADCPNFGKTDFNQIYALERSLKDVRVPLVSFETVMDLDI